MINQISTEVSQINKIRPTKIAVRDRICANSAIDQFKLLCLHLHIHTSIYNGVHCCFNLFPDA